MANPLAADLDEVTARLATVWDELEGARILLTGGTGFYGCWLLETLAWAHRAAGRDQVHIDVGREEDVRYWSERLAVDADTLRRAVAAVGPLAYAVERFVEAHAPRE